MAMIPPRPIKDCPKIKVDKEIEYTIQGGYSDNIYKRRQTTSEKIKQICLWAYKGLIKW